MKTLRIGMLFLSILLILTGCKVNIATPAASDSFAYDVDEYDTGDTGYQFEVSNITKTKYGDGDDYLITVDFSDPVAKEGLQEGIAFSKLEDADNEWTMPKKTPLTAELLSVSGTEARFKINLKDVHDLYIYLTASKIKAKSGAVLNSDGDKIFGEPGDDDYSYYVIIGVSTLTKGNVGYDKEIIVGNKTLPAIPVGFAYGIKEKQKLISKVNVDGSLLIPFFTATHLGEPDEKVEKFGEIASSLKNYLKIEQYKWETGTWEEVETNFTVNAGVTGWESDITLDPYRFVRYKWVKLNELKIKSHKYAYDIKYSLKNVHETTKVGTGSPTGSVSFDDRYILNSVSTDVSNSGYAEITLGLPSFPNSVYDETADAFNIGVSGANSDPLKPSMFKGFDMATVNINQFKVLDFEGKSIKLKEVISKSSNVTNYPSALDVLILVFEDPDQEADSIYMSPEVKMASFTGSNSNGDPYEIPALRMVNIGPTADANALKGWNLIP